MKKLLFVDYSEEGKRLKEIRAALSDNNIETFASAVKLVEYIKENQLSQEHLICLHFSNPQIVPQIDRSSENSAFIEIRQQARKANVQVFSHTGGVDNGVSIKEDNDVVFNYNWLLVNIKNLLESWSISKDSKDYINVINEVLNTHSSTNVFTSLDILIQGYFTLDGAAEDNPWGWLPKHEPIPMMPEGKKMAKQRLGEIQKDPFKWFEPAVESLKEIFPPDSSGDNKNLERTLVNMPITKQKLMINSELVEFSKFIMSVYQQKER